VELYDKNVKLLTKNKPLSDFLTLKTQLLALTVLQKFGVFIKKERTAKFDSRQ
jgi:hypothetical protein